MDETRERDGMDSNLIDAINRMDGETFEALATKLLYSMGLEIVSSKLRDEKCDIEATVGEKIRDADYPSYLIRVERKKESIAPEELQDLVASRKDRDIGTIYISTADFSEEARLYAKEFEIEIVDDEALATLVRRFDLLPDVMIYKDRQIMKEEKGRFLPSLDELENILTLGNKAYARKNYAEALGHFTNAIRLKPNYDNAWYMKGVILNDLKRYEEAIKAFVKALDINIENENVWYNMGLSLYALGRYDEELECYDRVIVLNRGFLNAWNNKGTTLLQLERPEEAIECFDEIVKYNLGFEKAWNNKGIALKKLKRGEEAIECFTKAIEIHPSYRDAWLNKGLMYLDGRRYKEAYGCFEVVLRIKAKDVQALYNKAKTLERVGQFSMAIECYESIIALEPEFKPAKRRLKKALKSLEVKGDSPIDEDFFGMEQEFPLAGADQKERILVEKKAMMPREFESEVVKKPTSTVPLPVEKITPQVVQPTSPAESKKLIEMRKELETKERNLASMETKLRERYETIEKEGSEIETLKTDLETASKDIEKEKMNVRNMAENLKEKEKNIARAEELIKKANEQMKNERVAIEKERKELSSKAEAIAKGKDETKEVRDAIQRKLGESELKEKEIKVAEEALAKEKEALDKDLESLEKERQIVEQARGELTAKESSIHQREEEMKKHYEEMETRIKGISHKERELEKMAYELKERQEELDVQAKVLADKERSLEEDMKILSEERLPEKYQEDVEEFLRGLEKASASEGEGIKAKEAEEGVAKDFEVSFETGLEEVKPGLIITIEEWMEEELEGEESDSVKEISALYSLKYLDEAIKRIEKAQNEGEESKILWNIKGNILWDKKRRKEALECYNRALKLDQNYIVTLANLMSLNIDLGNYSEVYGLCEKLLALRPRDERFVIEKAMLEARDGQIDKALSTLDVLLEENENLENVWNMKGLLLHGLNREDEALSCFERALNISSDHAIFLNNKGVMLYHVGKYKEAKECFDKAIEIMPFEQIAHNKKATLEKMSGKKEGKELGEVIKEMKVEKEVVDEAEKMVKTPEAEVKEEKDTKKESVSLYMCPSCGAFVSEDATKCQKCGYNFEEEESGIATKELDEKEAITKLTRISGIGTSKAKALYEAGYRSFKDLREASIADLAKVKGIGSTVAKIIKKRVGSKKFKDG